MGISRDELDDLRAQAAAQKFMINAILIGLVDKNVFTRADVEVLIESTVASLDHLQPPNSEAITAYLNDFRIAFQHDT
jgi:hypothetical protein